MKAGYKAFVLGVAVFFVCLGVCVADHKQDEKDVAVMQFVSSAPVCNGFKEIKKSFENPQAWKKLSAEAKQEAAEVLGHTGSVLDTIDVVSVLGQAAGHAYAGDADAAFATIFSDLCKKGMVAGASSLGSVVPGGTVLAGWAAEQVHSQYIDKGLEKNVDRIRDQEYRDKYLLQPPRQKVWNKDGTVRELPADMYLGRDGLVHRRSPEEQRAYVNNWHDDRMKAARTQSKADERKLQALGAALKNDDITLKEYQAQTNSIMKRNQAEIKQLETELDETKHLVDLEQKRREKLMEQGEKQEYKEEKARVKTYLEGEQIDKILETVEPARIVADGGMVDSEIRAKLVLIFWNVGSMLSGHGKATMTASMHSALGPDTNTFRGTFSGGPNGQFVLSDGETTVKARLVNGSTVNVNGVVLKVKNPQGFKGWPES